MLRSGLHSRRGSAFEPINRGGTHLELGWQGLAWPGQHRADQLHVWADRPHPLGRPVGRHNVHHQPPALLGQRCIKSVPPTAVHRVCQGAPLLPKLLGSQMRRDPHWMHPARLTKSAHHQCDIFYRSLIVQDKQLMPAMLVPWQLCMLHARKTH